VRITLELAPLSKQYCNMDVDVNLELLPSPVSMMYAQDYKQTPSTIFTLNLTPLILRRWQQCLWHFSSCRETAGEPRRPVKFEPFHTSYCRTGPECWRQFGEGVRAECPIDRVIRVIGRMEQFVYRPGISLFPNFLQHTLAIHAHPTTKRVSREDHDITGVS